MQLARLGHAHAPVAGIDRARRASEWRARRRPARPRRTGCRSARTRRTCARDRACPREAKETEIGVDARQHGLELDLLGAEARRRGVGDVVGDGVQPPLQRDLGRQADVEVGLHRLGPPSFRFCRLASRSAPMPSSSGWANSSGRRGRRRASGSSHLPEAGEAVEELVELLRVLEVRDVELCRDHLRLLVDVHGGRRGGDAERGLHHLQEGRIGKDAVGAGEARRLALEIERQPHALVLLPASSSSVWRT